MSIMKYEIERLRRFTKKIHNLKEALDFEKNLKLINN